MTHAMITGAVWGFLFWALLVILAAGQPGVMNWRRVYATLAFLVAVGVAIGWLV